MQVYILKGQDYYDREYSEIVGVYSSVESAHKAKVAMEKDHPTYYHRLSISMEPVLD